VSQFGLSVAGASTPATPHGDVEPRICLCMIVRNEESNLSAALEPVGRGPSMGMLGVLTRDRLDLGLTIRTAAVDGDRVHLWAGGGITWDSDPAAEVAEAAAKAAPLRAAFAPR